MLNDKITSLQGFRADRQAATLKARVRAIRDQQEHLETLLPEAFLGASAADRAADAVDRGLTLLRIQEGAREVQLPSFLKTNATLASPVLGEVVKSLQGNQAPFEHEIITDLVDHVYAERIGGLAADVEGLLAQWPQNDHVSLNCPSIEDGALHPYRTIEMVRVADSPNFKSIGLGLGSNSIGVVVMRTPHLRAEVHLRVAAREALAEGSGLLDHIRSVGAMKASPYFLHKRREDTGRVPLYAAEHDTGYVASAYEDLEFDGHWTCSNVIMRFPLMREIMSLLGHLGRRGLPHP